MLISRFKFPVEILTLERYVAPGGDRVYRFDPFLADVPIEPISAGSSQPSAESLDPDDIDTIVVPARDDGFTDVFLGENRWYKIRIHSSMIPRLKHIAVYRVQPESAITHIAPIKSIDQWPDTRKYVVNFAEPAKPIGPIHLIPHGKVRAPQAPRYTSRTRLEHAKNLDEAF